ncbi:histidine kinase N-terminal 7TM domain-containing protein [Paenibacillus sp. NPDC058071]|uniref:histidine kinase N-terminal 7TM domain-containing diguanylate cyclase n=1 Tax=Paenibacillus sp. NPDC058071 TaxID=3346326 RepID=UPI0036DBAC60
MGTPYSAVITLMVTAGVINLIMGIYVWFNRSKQPMAKAFIALSLFSAVYTFGSALEKSADTLAEVMLWIKFEYLGMPLLPPLSLLLIIHFLGMDRFLKPALKKGMFVMPIITIALVLTNEWHHFYYRSVTVSPGVAFLRVELDAGPWYIIQGAYTFGCMIGGLVLLLVHWNRMKSSYRPQHISMMLGLLLPIIGDFAYLGNLTPQGMDPIPVIMAVTAALYLWALASKGMLNVAPIARDYLFESMSDGVFVLDHDNRLVDYNKAAALIMPELKPAAVGRSLEPLWRLHTDVALDMTPVETVDLTEGGQEEIAWRLGDKSMHYQVRVSAVRNRNGQQIGRLIVLIDVTEMVRLQEQLRKLAYHDGLTGVYNRMHFIHLSESLLWRSSSNQTPLALVLFDIDHFKRINDEFGHDAGDRALTHIVGVCRSLLRPEDVFARYGGEEFVLAMPGLTGEQAEAAAHRLRAGIAGQPLQIPMNTVYLTASFGIAVAESDFPYEEEGAIDRLLKAADRALYRSKDGGRNTVHRAGREEINNVLIGKNESVGASVS